MLRDLRYCWRLLARRPTSSLLAILAIGLGIGSVTLIYSVIDAVLIRALPYEAPDRLVMVWESNADRGEEESAVSPPLVADWMTEADTFEDLAALWSPTLNLTVEAGEPERVQAADVTGGFFGLLGSRAEVGRLVAAGEDGPEAEKVVVLSHSFWQRRFGGGRDVLGRTLHLDDVAHTVIGVLPASFDLPHNIELWRPVGFELRMLGRNARFMNVVGRLAEGRSLDDARRQLETIAARLEQEHPTSNAGWSVRLKPLREHVVGPVRAILVTLFVASALMLAIACANVASLLLARVTSREPELALRAALGSSRFGLARQLVFEGLVIAVSGGALALALIYWGFDLFLAFLPADLPRLEELGVDWRVALFALLTMAVAGLSLGLVPALSLGWRRDLFLGLKTGSRGGRSTGRLHRALVAVEVALAALVLIAAGLLTRSFLQLLSVDPGFRSESLLTFKLHLPTSAYQPGPQITGFYQASLERLSQLPGVSSVAATAFLPTDPSAWRLGFSMPDRPPASADEELSTEYRVVTPGCFQTLGIPLLAGRDLSERDAAERPGAVVINETMARRFWPEGDALGRVVIPSASNFGRLGRLFTDSFEVVGIVADVKNGGLAAKPQPAMYFSYRQFSYRSMIVVARTAADPLSMVRAVRESVWSVDPDVPLAEVRSGEQVLAELTAPQRFNMLLLGLFGAITLVLAAVGIYGVLTYATQQRRREIGIRMALGGLRSQVLWMVLRDGLRLALWGLALGLAAALSMTWLLRSLLFDVRPTDPLTLGATTLLLLAVAALSTLLPAVRATRIEPMTILRYE